MGSAGEWNSKRVAIDLTLEVHWPEVDWVDCTAVKWSVKSQNFLLSVRNDLKNGTSQPPRRWEDILIKAGDDKKEYSKRGSNPRPHAFPLMWSMCLNQLDHPSQMKISLACTDMNACYRVLLGWYTSIAKSRNMALLTGDLEQQDWNSCQPFCFRVNSDSITKNKFGWNPDRIRFLLQSGRTLRWLSMFGKRSSKNQKPSWSGLPSNSLVTCKQNSRSRRWMSAFPLRAFRVHRHSLWGAFAFFTCTAYPIEAKKGKYCKLPLRAMTSPSHFGSAHSFASLPLWVKDFENDKHTHTHTSPSSLLLLAI